IVIHTAATASSAGMSKKTYLKAMVQCDTAGFMKKAINASCMRGIHAIGISTRSMTSCQRSGTVMLLSFHQRCRDDPAPQGVSDFGAVRGSTAGRIGSGALISSGG